MERELGISYPTVRSRVEALVRALGFGPRSDSDGPSRASPSARSRRDPRGAGTSRDDRRGRRDSHPFTWEDRLMTATLRGVLDHVIGAEGVLSIRFASGEVRLRAIDGTAVRVRDRSEQDIAAMFEIDRAEGSLSLHRRARSRLVHVKGTHARARRRGPAAGLDRDRVGQWRDRRRRPGRRPAVSHDVGRSRAPPVRRADRGRGCLGRHRCRGRRRDRPLGSHGFGRRRGPCRDASRTPGVHDERRPQDRRTVLVGWRVRGRHRQRRRPDRPGWRPDASR